MPTAVGDYLKENVLREQFVVESATYDADNPFITRTPMLDYVRGFGIVLVVEDYNRAVTVEITDSVVAVSGTWVFANAAFTANDVGSDLVVDGATNAGNNGTFVILTVVNATTVTTATTGLVDETFDNGDVTLSVNAADALAATTEVEVSNDYVAVTMPGNQSPNDGHWANVDDMFSPAPPSIAGAASVFFQADPLDARTARIIITPTAGAAYISMYYCAKGPK